MSCNRARCAPDRSSSLADFGAFVDIGGADGLVHLSEISWKRLGHPSEMLEVGQEVQVKVLAVDTERKRISLSMRELEPDPWEELARASWARASWWKASSPS